MKADIDQHAIGHSTQVLDPDAIRILTGAFDDAWQRLLASGARLESEREYKRLPALAAELVRRQVVVIVATGATPSVLAARAVTATIPIVFASGDPVKDGLVASFNRPGGNATGVSVFANVLAPKRLELLRELVPNAAAIAVLVDANSTDAEIQLKEVQAAAHAVGQQIYALNAGSEREFDTAFASPVLQQAGANKLASPHVDDPYWVTV
jgi:ABC-type uncharacterized transport system substrate-binding protein